VILPAPQVVDELAPCYQVHGPREEQLLQRVDAWLSRKVDPFVLSSTVRTSIRRSNLFARCVSCLCEFGKHFLPMSAVR
jgi:hypothetical protein